MIFTLTNRNGIEARIANYGGMLMSLKTPDRNGVFKNIVLGFDTVQQYMAEPQWYFGGIIGRCANRIARARFQLNGVEYRLTKNDGEHCLHGGNGFDRRLWIPEQFTHNSVRLIYRSPDGEEGFPGNLLVRADYRLSEDNTLELAFHATTDRDTVINLTAHPYFNLAGAGHGDILRHVLMLHADRFTPVDAEQIPTGEIRDVSGTEFDFRTPKAIESSYDHNWILNQAFAARVVEPASGRTLEIHTTEPGIQLYTGNHLKNVHSGFCLETQHFPDSPNRPRFPSTLLKAGATFSSKTAWRFGISA